MFFSFAHYSLSLIRSPICLGLVGSTQQKMFKHFPWVAMVLHVAQQRKRLNNNNRTHIRNEVSPIIVT